MRPSGGSGLGREGAGAESPDGTEGPWEWRGLCEAGASGQRKEFDGRGLETGVIVINTELEAGGRD